MKVLIADDEQKICQLICNLVDWDSIGMEVVGIANNGIDALKKIEQLKPNLVLTDIRMPGCSGLELIYRAKQMDEAIDFIIISGYRYFDYAQNAIRYGVSDYLLKPIKKEELLDTLIKMRQKYLTRTAQISQNEQQQLFEQSSISRLRMALFSEFLLSDTSEELTITKLNSGYHFQFVPGLFQVVIVKIDYDIDDFPFRDGIKIIEEKVIKILGHQLRNHCADLECYVRTGHVYCVLNYLSKETIRHQLKSALDDLLVQKSAFNSVEFTIGTGEPCTTPDQLRTSLQSAQCAIDQRLLEGTGRIIHQLPQPIIETTFLSDFTHQMSSSLDIFDIESVLRIAENFCSNTLNASINSGSQVLALISEAYESFLHLIRSNRFNHASLETLSASFTAKMAHCGSLDKLLIEFKHFVTSAVQYIANEKKQENTKPVRTAKQYIMEKYMHPISLDEVSEIVNFNPSYFSSMFKKECGKNFSEYVSEVRLNKAKELLKETKLSVADICVAVGYHDIKHFTQTFKKFTGIKPGEYRKLYS